MADCHDAWWCHDNVLAYVTVHGRKGRVSRALWHCCIMPRLSFGRLGWLTWNIFPCRLIPIVRLLPQSVIRPTTRNYKIRKLSWYITIDLDYCFQNLFLLQRIRFIVGETIPGIDAQVVARRFPIVIRPRWRSHSTEMTLSFVPDDILVLTFNRSLDPQTRLFFSSLGNNHDCGCCVTVLLFSKLVACSWCANLKRIMNKNIWYLWKNMFYA